MRTINSFILITISWMVLSLGFFSCGSAKKAAVSCPEFSNNRHPGLVHNHHRYDDRMKSAGLFSGRQINNRIYSLRYANGASEFFTQRSVPDSPRPYPAKKTEGLGITSFISSLVGLFISGIPLGILAVIFGAISLGKIEKYPDIYMGRGFAIVGIVLGIIDIVGVILLLALM